MLLQSRVVKLRGAISTSALSSMHSSMELNTPLICDLRGPIVRLKTAKGRHKVLDLAV
jgi:hypothetical protein